MTSLATLRGEQLKLPIPESEVKKTVDGIPDSSGRAGDATTTKLIIIADRALEMNEHQTLLQHGALMIIDPMNLPPISCAIDSLFPYSQGLRALFINVSNVNIRHWLELRVEEIKKFSYVFLKCDGETDTEPWIISFGGEAPVLKRIEPAFNLRDFVSQMLNYHHVKAPAKHWLKIIFDFIISIICQ